MSKSEFLIRNYESQINTKEKEIDNLEKIIKGYGFSDCETRKDFEFEKLRFELELDEVNEDILKAGSKYDPSSVVALKGREGRLKTKINNINDILVYFDKISTIESEIINLENEIKNLEKQIGTEKSEKEQMNIVLNALMNYESCEDAAKLANVKVQRIVNWIHEGRDGTSKNKIYFFKKFSNFETKKNRNISHILTYLKKGMTREESCKKENIPIAAFNRWYDNGKKGKGKKNIKFYNKVNHIEFEMEEDEKELMSKFLSEYKQSRSLEKSIQYAGISKSQYYSWCRDGRNQKNKNTINFVHKLDEICKSPKITPKPYSPPKSSKVNSNPSDSYTKFGQSKVSKPIKNEIIDTKKEKLDMNSFLSMYRRTNSLNRSLKSAGISEKQYHSWCTDGKNHKSKNTIYFVKELEKINKPNAHFTSRSSKYSKVSKRKDIDENQEKSVMDSFLSMYRRTNSLNRSLKSAGISEKQYHSWCSDGKNHKSKNTFYFVTELDKINRNRKTNFNKPSKPVKSIKKSKSNEVIMVNIVNHMLDGKNRAQAANMEGVSVFIANQLYNAGKNNKSPETVKFYNDVKRIESNVEKQVNEKRAMDKVLDYLRQGKSYDDAANYANVTSSLILAWCQKGKVKENPNAIYFYNKLKEIENTDYTKSKPKISLDSQKVKTNNDSYQMKDNEFNKSDSQKDLHKMGKFLEAQKEGYDKIKSCEIAGISQPQLTLWINQGRCEKNNETIAFVKEFDKLNPTKKKEEYNSDKIYSIKKKEKNISDKMNPTDKEDDIPVVNKNTQIYCPNCHKIVDKASYCQYCGHKLGKEKRKTSIFDKIKSFF